MIKYCIWAELCGLNFVSWKQNGLNLRTRLYGLNFLGLEKNGLKYVGCIVRTKKIIWAELLWARNLYGL